MRKLYAALFVICLFTADYFVWGGQPLLAPAPLLMAVGMVWLWGEG